MEPNSPNQETPRTLRCPACYGRDIVPSMPRHFWDEVMRGFGKLPKHCRTCGRRFYAREPRRLTAAQE